MTRKASPNAESKAQTTYMDAMDKALEERPPRIVWRNNGKGVQVAVSVIDPHAEAAGWVDRRTPDPVERHLYLDIVEKAYEPMDESLLNAARTEI